MGSRNGAFALGARDLEAIEDLLGSHLEPGQTATARDKALKECCCTIQELSLDVVDCQNV